MLPSGPDWLRRAVRDEFYRLISNALQSDEVLLYDPSGTPIRKDTEIWPTGQAEARRHVHKLLDRLLDGLPTDKVPKSPEDVIKALEELSKSTPNQTEYDIVEGKYSFPVRLPAVVSRLPKIKVTIPVYRIATLLMAGIGFWSSRRLLPRFPTWRSIRLGIHNSAEELVTALDLRGFKTEELATELLKTSTRISDFATDIDLVRVTARDLDCSSDMYADVCIRAQSHSLGLLPAEAGPQLRLQYVDQPQGEAVNVGMHPVRRSHGVRHEIQREARRGGFLSAETLLGYPLEYGFQLVGRNELRCFATSVVILSGCGTQPRGVQSPEYWVFQRLGADIGQSRT